MTDTRTLLTSITDLQRQINRLQAQQLEQIAAFADATDSIRGAPKELELALHMMPQHAANQITFAQDLKKRLPRTFEAMLAGGHTVGGEQSGHVIFLDRATTGDGLLTGLRLLSVVTRSGRPLSELATVMRRLPQVLVNVRVADRAALEGAEAVWGAVEGEEARLGGRGRVLVRPSGTEALVRVMVEAETEQEAGATADRLAAVVAAELG